MTEEITVVSKKRKRQKKNVEDAFSQMYKAVQKKKTETEKRFLE